MPLQKYEPSEIEPDLARKWVVREPGNPDASPPGSETFCIVMPPPNVTGVLHIGHALVNTIQDAIIRRKRMQGKKTLWLPGTDHAGIATQNAVEKELLKQNIKVGDLTGEQFIEKIWKWREESGRTILKQLKRLGATPDWSRERFTLDEGLSRSVKKAFVEFYNSGLIYRGEYLVNWCPEDCTALSDLEVDHKEILGELTTIAYPIEGESNFIEISTTRPETMLGDTAIAVNPEDVRYRYLIGKNAVVPLVGRIIPIIGEEYVDPAFGTGALKITPAHDPNDFEIGKKHGLQIINIFTENAQINGIYPDLQGTDRFEARKKIIALLKEKNFFRKSQEHFHKVGHSQRRGSIIEPRISEQWFCKTNDAAQKVLKKINAGALKVIPANQHKILIDWLSNIHDWCISRQLCWGHKIPAWHCQICKRIQVSEFEPPKFCPDCGSKNLKQDKDVLDTWFSSGLFPFSTMGWPEETEDYRNFYPNSTLITGYDILFFWVARMLLMGEMLTGKLPFPEVFTHGLVRDENGEKMSKSKGNVIDPLEIINEYGADSLRYSLLSGTVMGADLRISYEIFRNNKFFMNKLWNAMKFSLSHLERTGTEPVFSEETLNIFDAWFLQGLNKMIDSVNHNFENYRFHEVCNSIYSFVWDYFCDWYIEISKPILFGKLGEIAQKNSLGILVYSCRKILRIAHPVIPFITEKIWKEFSDSDSLLTSESYPESRALPVGVLKKIPEAELFIALIKSIRNLRGENGVAMNTKISVQIMLYDSNLKTNLQRYEIITKSLAGLGQIEIIEMVPENAENLVRTAESKFEIFANLNVAPNTEKEYARLRKSKIKLEEKILFLQKKLGNPSFVEKAPPIVIEKNKQEAEELQTKIDKINRLLSSLKSPK